jgi:hypothetical protein
MGRGGPKKRIHAGLSDFTQILMTFARHRSRGFSVVLQWPAAGMSDTVRPERAKPRRVGDGSKRGLTFMEFTDERDIGLDRAEANDYVTARIHVLAIGMVVLVVAFAVLDWYHFLPGAAVVAP